MEKNIRSISLSPPQLFSLLCGLAVEPFVRLISNKKFLREIYLSASDNKIDSDPAQQALI